MLMSAIYPPTVGHIHKIESLATNSLHLLISLAASFASLPIDAFVKILGKGDFNRSLIESIPLVKYRSRYKAAAVRILGLNCLIKPYADLWASAFDNDFKTDSWTSYCAQLQKNWFSILTPEWTPKCSLRSDINRRQALLELDVLTAQAMGLSLTDLLTMYRFNFRTLAGYEQTTCYDQNGRIIFTKNRGMTNIGLPNKKRSSDASNSISYRMNGYEVGVKGLGFEDVKNMKEGFVEKTFPDISMCDEPVMTTVKYVAPFFRMDREADYRRAWEVFEKRFGKVGGETSEPSTETPSEI